MHKGGGAYGSTGIPSTGGPPVSKVEKAPTQSKLERRVAEAEILGEVGRSLGSFANLTVGPDGCRGWPSTLGGGSQPGGSSNLPWEARPPKGIPHS